MRGEDALPDDVDHIDIDIGTFGRPVLLKLLQRGGSIIGSADVLDLITGLLCPLLSGGPRPTAAFSHVGVAGEADSNSLGEHGRGKPEAQRERAEQRNKTRFSGAFQKISTRRF